MLRRSNPPPVVTFGIGRLANESRALNHKRRQLGNDRTCWLTVPFRENLPLNPFETNAPIFLVGEKFPARHALLSTHPKCRIVHGAYCFSSMGTPHRLFWSNQHMDRCSKAFPNPCIFSFDYRLPRKRCGEHTASNNDPINIRDEEIESPDSLLSTMHVTDLLLPTCTDNHLRSGNETMKLQGFELFGGILIVTSLPRVGGTSCPVRWDAIRRRLVRNGREQ